MVSDNYRPVDLEKEFRMSEGEFNSHLSAILSRSVKPVEVYISGTTKLEPRFPIVAGTQSDTYEVNLRDYRADSGGKQLPETYVLKVLRPNIITLSEKEDAEDQNTRFRIEAGVLSITNDPFFAFTSYSFSDGREVKIFPYLYSSGYTPFEERRMLLLERLRDISVHDRFTNSDKEEISLRDDIEPALDPVLLLHEKFAIFGDEVKSVLGDRTVLLNPEQYTEKVLRYLEKSTKTERRKWSKGLEDRIASPTLNFSKKFLSNPRFSALIQHDGYPWHVMFRSLVDTGNIREGSRLLHLGALFGERSIYNKLPEQAFMEIARAYIEKDLKLILDDLKFGVESFRLRKYPSPNAPTQYEKDALTKEIETGMYFGAFVSNIRLIGGFSHYENGKRKERDLETYKIKKTVEEQLQQLAIREPSAQEIIEGMYELGVLEGLSETSADDDPTTQIKFNQDTPTRVP